MSNSILEQIADLVMEKDDATFEVELLKFVAWIRDARARAQRNNN